MISIIIEVLMSISGLAINGFGIAHILYFFGKDCLSNENHKLFFFTLEFYLFCLLMSALLLTKTIIKILGKVFPRRDARRNANSLRNGTLREGLIVVNHRDNRVLNPLPLFREDLSSPLLNANPTGNTRSTRVGQYRPANQRGMFTIDRGNSNIHTIGSRRGTGPDGQAPNHISNASRNLNQTTRRARGALNNNPFGRSPYLIGGLYSNRQITGSTNRGRQVNPPPARPRNRDRPRNLFPLPRRNSNRNQVRVGNSFPPPPVPLRLHHQGTHHTVTRRNEQPNTRATTRYSKQKKTDHFERHKR